jgi:hypothetical protein
MRCLLSIRKPVAMALILALVNLAIAFGSASAGMISTGAVLQQERCALDKERLLSLVERSEVQQRLQSLGVDPAAAKARIDALTDRELARIAQNMDELPAGGNAVGALVGAGVFIFIVLLITDILGFTDVFTFVER